MCLPLIRARDKGREAWEKKGFLPYQNFKQDVLITERAFVEFHPARDITDQSNANVEVGIERSTQ